MAFDKRLESDYVDLNLGTILSYTPILGSVWSLLRGSRRRSREEDQQQEDETEEQLSPRRGLSRNFSAGELPDLMASSLSVRDISVSSMQDFNDTEKAHQLSFRRSKRSKKALSWSDISGQGKLCEYFDYDEKRHPGDDLDEEKSSAAAAVLETQLCTRDKESGMSRSKTSRKQLKSDDNHTTSSNNSYQISKRANEQQRHSYLPRMDPHKPGIVMPSMHRSSASASHPGEQHQGESPQYGFYVNLTPPSPELYTSSSKHQKVPSSHSVASTSASSVCSTTGATVPWNKRPIVAKPVNPIFQGLLLQQQRNNHNRNGAVATTNFPTAPL